MNGLDLAKYEFNLQQERLKRIRRTSEDWTLNECRRVISKAEQVMTDLDAALELHTIQYLIRDLISETHKVNHLRIKCANERIDELTDDRCEVCVGPLSAPIHVRKDGSEVCSMCNVEEDSE
tara:strand:- start:749 stop:1114 length:366 start_codon:yes stop_codon:yes gene_type:complete